LEQRKKSSTYSDWEEVGADSELNDHDLGSSNNGVSTFQSSALAAWASNEEKWRRVRIQAIYQRRNEYEAKPSAEIDRWKYEMKRKKPWERRT
jgi:hypothetical protein